MFFLISFSFRLDLRSRFSREHFLFLLHFNAELFFQIFDHWEDFFRQVYMRQEQIYLERYMETVNLINRNDLGTADKVQAFIDEKEAEMAMLLSARNKIDNRRRRATTDAEKEECSRKRKAISKELKAIRHDTIPKDFYVFCF